MLSEPHQQMVESQCFGTDTKCTNREDEQSSFDFEHLLEETAATIDKYEREIALLEE